MHTDTLLLKEFLGEAMAEDYVDWAVERLLDEDDTLNLRVLAGLSPKLDRDDIKPTFYAAADELGIVIPAENTPVMSAAMLIWRSHLRGDLNALEVVHHMSYLFVKSEYSEPLLSVWWDLDEELSCVNTEAAGYCYPLDANFNLVQIVQQEWELLDRARRTALPDNFWELFQCANCSLFDVPTVTQSPVRKAISSVFPIVPPPRKLRCPHCQSEDLSSIRTPVARHALLDQLESR